MSVIPKIHTKEDIELLRKMYIEERLSTTIISDLSLERFKYKISPANVYQALIRNKISLRSIGDSVSMAMSTLDISKSHLNEEVMEWIDGFNLGDGYINFNKKRSDCRGARFCFGSVSKEWTDYAMSGLKAYCPSESCTIGNIDSKHPHLTWSSATLTHPDIVAQAKRWYPNGKKIIPLDVRVTPTSLLLWYLGDGSISKMGVSFFVRLATCAFTVEEVENILMPKLTALGLSVGRHVSKNDIRISGSSLRRFFEIIGKQSPIACYNYKFDYGQWLNMYRLSDIVKNNQEKWRVQYMFKQGKLDCKISPGGRLIMFTEEQKDKIRAILDAHCSHEEYENLDKEIRNVQNTGLIKISDIVENDIERWNARYLVTRDVIKCEKSMLTKEQAELLRLKLNDYGKNSAIPQYMIDSIFREYREKGFPYYRYSDEKLMTKISQIKNFVPDNQNGIYKWSGHGTELANYFHPQMFECRKKERMSPIEFFNSDIDFKRGISKIIALYPKIAESNIREICCNEVASSRINNFPPRVMMTILKHLYDGKTITMLDPCAGFSGRLLGCYASGIVKKYIGIDLSHQTYEGLMRTKEWINKIDDNAFSCDIIEGNCIDVLPSIKGQIDFVFTSPPFLDEEEYTGIPVEKNYDTWKSVFVRPFIERSYNVLKLGGKLSVYIEAIRRNDFPLDFCNIAKDIGFRRLDDINFKMPSRENLRKDRTFRLVKVIVFEK